MEMASLPNRHCSLHWWGAAAEEEERDCDGERALPCSRLPPLQAKSERAAMSDRRAVPPLPHSLPSDRSSRLHPPVRDFASLFG